MIQLSTLVLAALSGYTQLVLSKDAEYFGCYSNQGSLVLKQTDKFQSMGACRETCVDVAANTGGPSYAVQAMTNSTLCFCSQTLPNDIYKTDDSSCKQTCPGWSSNTCGSRLGEYFSVYLTGEDSDPGSDPLPESSTTSNTSTGSSAPTNGPTQSGPVETVEPTISPPPAKPVNKAGVAAGVVVGVLAIAGIGIGLFLLTKKRRREKVEEEYRKSAAAREFARKPEQDHRLDPVMIQRRDSVGSIADNQDYSRRILKVTNPDGN